MVLAFGVRPRARGGDRGAEGSSGGSLTRWEEARSLHRQGGWSEIQAIKEPSVEGPDVRGVVITRQLIGGPGMSHATLRPGLCLGALFA